MDEFLDRHELPIQSILERDEALTATVPIHQEVLSMHHGLRTSSLLLVDAQATVSQWYNEDMDYYRAVLKNDECDSSWLKGYEKFNPEWRLRGEKGKHGFLKLLWEEGKEKHSIAYLPIPVILYVKN